MKGRIRSVKPEFFHHPVLSKESDGVQLLALALLPFSDDEGYFWAAPSLVRASCRPQVARVVTVERALDRLVELHYIEVCDTPNGKLGRVVSFRDHQRIDRPTPSKLAKYWSGPERDDSTNPRRGLAAGGEGKGREGSRDLDQGGEEATREAPVEKLGQAPQLPLAGVDVTEPTATRPPGAPSHENPALAGFYRLQSLKRANGIPQERIPPPVHRHEDLWGAWLKLRESTGKSTETEQEAFIWRAAELFLTDAHWSSKQYPFNAFVKQGTDYVNELRTRG